ASAISGKRPDQSCPLRVISRTPAGSRRAIMRKPSSLTSWIQPGPDGGRSAGEGRQGSINADTRIAEGFRASADTVKPRVRGICSSTNLKLKVMQYLLPPREMGVILADPS